MDKLYYFFDMDYEAIAHPPDLPFRVVLESVGYVGLHWHPDMEILLMLKGKVHVTNSRKQYALQAGQVMLINSNEMHSLVEVTDNLMLVLQVDPEVFQSSSEDSAPKEYLLHEETRLPEDILHRLRAVIARLSLEKWEQRKGYELHCKAALYEIAGTIIRHIPSCPAKEDKSRPGLRQARVKHFLDYLHRHYRRKITLQEMAGAMGISPYYLSHLVKEGTGWSFQENLNLIRTGKAIDLLLKTDRNLLEISLSVGFSDPKYFNQYFKRLFGMTPREFKRRPDWKQAVLIPLDHQGLDPEWGRSFLLSYAR